MDPQKLKQAKAIAIFMTIAFAAFVFYLIFIPVQVADSSIIEVEISSGQGLSQIASTLKNKGLIRSESIFILYVKVIGDAANLKAGRYVFYDPSIGGQASLNIPEIIDILVSGKSEPDDIEITIPEGLNVWDIDKRLAQAGLIQESRFSSQYHNDEGYLFPDTYRLKNYLPAQAGELKITDYEKLLSELREKMGVNFNAKTEELFSALDGSQPEAGQPLAGAKSSGGKNLSNEQKLRTIIIASILEKEARSEKDMRLVAGIIEKRLKLDIPLQIDATVIYGACRREFAKSNFSKNCDVTFQGPAVEIKIDGPFNTYIHKGLPPAPISNPGLKAINAALNPQESDYLYYLSTRDGSQMIYSKTAGEHSANRRKYLGI
ncbi:MAG: endolytic transglycosylase MltG [Candidatus Yanofskybacteria bacterium]|nr:endolytic transglycosylase MltG [Candidatus Yanofskybacteria bacterium]